MKDLAVLLYAIPELWKIASINETVTFVYTDSPIFFIYKLLTTIQSIGIQVSKKLLSGWYFIPFVDKSSQNQVCIHLVRRNLLRQPQ